MNTPVHKETYRGCIIKIFHDDDAQSPDEWGNEDLFLITTRNRYFTVERDGFNLDSARDGEYKRDYHVIPLFAYIHSGVALSIGRGGQFSDPWDSGQIGYVLVKKRSGFRNIQRAAESLVNEWNDYLSGNVYGYVVEESGSGSGEDDDVDEDMDGEHIDSCWGFYGDYEKGVLVEARSICEARAKERESVERMEVSCFAI